MLPCSCPPTERDAILANRKRCNSCTSISLKEHLVPTRRPGFAPLDEPDGIAPTQTTNRGTVPYAWYHTALQDKLERADKLVSGLAGEFVRWQASIGTYESMIERLVGDSLIAAAFLSYAGTFDTVYRCKNCSSYAYGICYRVCTIRFSWCQTRPVGSH